MINLKTPYGKGYSDCEKGISIHNSPYNDDNQIPQWIEWLEGWYRALNENRYGIQPRYRPKDQ